MTKREIWNHPSTGWLIGMPLTAAEEQLQQLVLELAIEGDEE